MRVQEGLSDYKKVGKGMKSSKKIQRIGIFT
jgi:hypothetical protein